METNMDRIAARARKQPKIRFSSLAHHITSQLLESNLKLMNNKSAIGIDSIDVMQAKETFNEWSQRVLTKVHRKGYKPPAVRRVWIPKPGKSEKRPIGVPSVIDRVLQRSVASVLSNIYEQDFLDVSFGGRMGKSAHNALATLDRRISSCKISWVFEADLKNYFGSLDHKWMMKFVEHRISDPRILSLINRWLKAGVVEDNSFSETTVGTPQGGSISVLLSNIYLHYVLDLWFEKVVKPNMKGETYLIRYIDDFVVCFQHQSDALTFQEEISKRLDKFGLKLEPNKTRLISFGRFAVERAEREGKKPNTMYFLGFTHYCTKNRQGNFRVGRKTEKSRLKRSIAKLRQEMKANMHLTIKEQAKRINQILRGHYNYYGVAGNSISISQIYMFVQRFWKSVLQERSWRSKITWDKYNKLLELFPIVAPKLKINYDDWGNYAVL